MAAHKQITMATDLAIYFCDPHSPWQRGSNENTNGLLRQYFPKGTNLAGYSREHLDAVAAELNARPRKTLGWKTPAQALEEVLADAQPDGGGCAAAAPRRGAAQGPGLPLRRQGCCASLRDGLRPALTPEPLQPLAGQQARGRRSLPRSSAQRTHHSGSAPIVNPSTSDVATTH